MIRHAVLQLAPRKGHLAHNIAAIGQALQALQAERPQVVVLPEAYLSGYFLQGGVREVALERHHLEAQLTQMYQQLGWPDPLDLIIGFYEVEQGVYYNSAAYLELGGVACCMCTARYSCPPTGSSTKSAFCRAAARYGLSIPALAGQPC